MRRLTIIAATLGLVATAAFAQDQPGQRGPGGGEGWRGRGGGWRGPRLERVAERLRTELALDETQQTHVDQLVAAHEQRMQEMRGKWRELREAEESGDEARANVLREEMRANRPGPGGGPLQELFDQIEPILREDQLEAFHQMREQFPPPEQMRQRWQGMREMIRGLPDAVQMTEAQRTEYEALLQERREMMMERFRQRRESGEEPGNWQPPEPAQAMDEFFGDVSELLNKDQLALLEQYRTEYEAGAQAGRQTGPDVRTLFSAAKRISKLDRTQEAELRKMEREAMRLSRELGRADREGQAMIVADAKDQIIKLLEPAQVEEFERNLERLQNRGGRERRGDRERPLDRQRSGEGRRR